MQKIFSVILFAILLPKTVLTQNIIPANDTCIQYYGRWDKTDPAGPTHSWPGVYIYAVFQGTSIGIRTDDNFSYYNVFIDSIFMQVFHGNLAGVNSYILHSGLPDGTHTILLTVRGENSWTKFGFYGFIIDNGRTLLPPPPKPARRIEFIGDSYTCASGNEWTDNNTAPPNDSYSNIYLGFGPIIARHYNAQYQMTSRSGIGLVHDYNGNVSENLPTYFNRTLFYTPDPQWNFSQWIPNLVVISLGLNDYSGWNGYNAPIPDEDAQLYRMKYHDFMATVMGEYPGANIVAVAANDIAWLKTNILQVVTEENAMGHTNVHYAYFPYYEGGYVNIGHPSVATHQKIGDTLIYAIDTMNIWQPYHGTAKPKITQYPQSPFTVYDTSYTINITTDSYATMKYSSQDKPYAQMETTFTTTGKRTHSVTLSCHNGIQYKYYIRGIDVYGNATDTSAIVQFTADTTRSVVPWTSMAYDHTHWKSGKAPLGNALDTSVATHTGTVKTAYYKNSFSISGFSISKTYTLTVSGNDGAVVYINGVQSKIINMSSNPVAYDLLALQSLHFNQSFSYTRASGILLLQEGMNDIGIEVHTASSSNISTSFDASIRDENGNSLLSSGSTWYYYDEGAAPPDQLVNTITGVAREKRGLVPVKTKLYANYPNPFNPMTTFKFDLSTQTHVRLSVFNLLGQEIAVVLDGQKEAGSYSIQLNAAHLASGVYFYRMETGSFVANRKMLLLK
jgi:hypothetical protein